MGIARTNAGEGWSDEDESTSEEQVQMYPNIRKITGEYLMREITLK